MQEQFAKTMTTCPAKREAYFIPDIIYSQCFFISQVVSSLFLLVPLHRGWYLQALLKALGWASV
jgi:hypothetical protein